MRMGRLYRGQTKRKITKVAITKTRETKKEGGGAKTRPQGTNRKKEGGEGVTLSAVSTGHHDAIQHSAHLKKLPFLRSDGFISRSRITRIP